MFAELDFFSSGFLHVQVTMKPKRSYVVMGGCVFIAGLNHWGGTERVCRSLLSGWRMCHCPALNLLPETEQVMGGHEIWNDSEKPLPLAPGGAEWKPFLGFWVSAFGDSQSLFWNSLSSSGQIVSSSCKTYCKSSLPSCYLVRNFQETSC